ncbi:MAG: hypothetical protein KAG10_08725, partial [Methylococcales bacterium]|nr:hypothetical protein [Methylococcales bacterium]
DASAIALTAAQGLTIDYIDYSIEIIKDFNTHYQCFVGSLEKTLNRLEKTTLDKALLDPLTHCFETVKIPENDKITDSVNKKGWSYKLDLLFAWLRIRMGLDGHK